MLQAQPPWSAGAPVPEAVSQEAQAAYRLFFSLLDEQPRRWYAGLQSRLLGHSVDQQIAALLGLDPHTVAKGRRQLVDQDVQVERTRRAGGGRPPVEKNA